MQSSEKPKATGQLTLLGALLLGAGVGYLLTVGTRQPTPKAPPSAQVPSKSERPRIQPPATRNPILLSYFAQCEDPQSNDPHGSWFQSSAVRRQQIREWEESERQQLDEVVAKYREQFHRLKGTAEGAAEIAWAKDITNWEETEGGSKSMRRKLAFMLWLDQDPAAAMAARANPSESDLYLFVEDHPPAKIFALDRLSDKQAGSLVTAFVSRNGGAIFDHLPAVRGMMLQAHGGKEKNADSTLTYLIGSKLPTSYRTDLIAHAKKFKPSMLDELASRIAKRMEDHDQAEFLDTIWREGDLAAHISYHSPTQSRLWRLMIKAHELPVAERYERYVEYSVLEGGMSERGAEEIRARMLALELPKTFGASERNYLHDYGLGKLTASQMLEEINKMRPDLGIFPEASINKALFHSLARTDAVSALPLLDDLPAEDREKVISDAIGTIGQGNHQHPDPMRAMELAAAAPASPTMLRHRYETYLGMALQAEKDISAPMMTTWLSELPPSIERDLLAGHLAAGMDDDQPDLQTQAEGLISSDQIRESYRSGKFHQHHR